MTTFVTWERFREEVWAHQRAHGHNNFGVAATAVAKQHWGPSARFVQTGDGGRDTSWDGRGNSVSPKAWDTAIVLCPGGAAELHAAIVFDD